MYVCVYVCVYVCMWEKLERFACKSTSYFIHTVTCINTHTYTHTYIHRRFYVCMCVCMCVCMHVRFARISDWSDQSDQFMIHWLHRILNVEDYGIHVCWLQLTSAYADVCWRVLLVLLACGEQSCWRRSYADACWQQRMLTYADVCWRMLTYADVCWRMLLVILAWEAQRASTAQQCARSLWRGHSLNSSSPPRR
jgi:hypothetical protein